RAMAEHSHGDLLVQLPFVRSEAWKELVPVVLRLDRPDIGIDALEEDLEGGLVGDARLEAVLRTWVAPARVHPDLGVVEPLDGVVEEVYVEVEGRLVRAPRGGAVDCGLLDLDDLASRRHELPELGVEQRCE